jgi:hypothetical protein
LVLQKKIAVQKFKSPALSVLKCAFQNTDKQIDGGTDGHIEIDLEFDSMQIHILIKWSRGITSWCYIRCDKTNIPLIHFVYRRV